MKRLLFQGVDSAGGANSSTSVISNLQKLLGANTVFVQIAKGQKRPILPAWQTLTIADMTPDYLSNLENGNIGVVLGDASEGLCSIDFDTEDHIAEFLELNPCMNKTLTSKGARGCNFWVRIKGEYPKLTKFRDANDNPIGEWRSTGGQTVIHGIHPSGCNYSIVNEYSVITLPYDEIVWGKGWYFGSKKDEKPEPQQKEVKPCAVENPFVMLIQEYGKPYHKNETTGCITKINEVFWAGLIAHENHILFEPNENRFYLYETKNGLWSILNEAVLCQIINRRLLEVSRESGETDMEKHRDIALLRNIISHLKGVCPKAGVFDERKPIIHVQNGVLTTPKNSGEDIALCSFSPEFYSRNQTPLKYDKRAECPRFLNELLYASMSQDDAELLQMYAGQCLLGENLSQTILILHGEGGTGKSTIADVINGLIGHQNVFQLRTEHIGERFEIARYYGKTLLTGADVDPNFLKQRGANVLKSLTGGDILHGENKHTRESLPIKGNFNVLITCNQRLLVTIQGDVSAWLRRLLIIEFTGKPPEKKIPNFAQLLIETEGSGILNWAIEGAVKLLNRLHNGEPICSSEHYQRVENMLAESQSVRYFLKDCVESTTEGNVTKDELLQAYADYCGTRGWKIVSRTEFSSQVGELMLELFHINESHSLRRGMAMNIRGYSRVRLKNATEVIAEEEDDVL